MGLYIGDKLISSNLAGGDTNPIGSVIAFAGSNAPVGYLMCDGSAVSRTTYADLFAVIGTTYGAGDGSTTFNLPKMNTIGDYIIDEKFKEEGNKKVFQRKWNSGVAEFICYLSSTADADTVWSAPIYYHSYSTQSNLFNFVENGLFIEAPYSVLISPMSPLFFQVYGYQISKNGIGLMRAMSVTSKTGEQLDVCIHAIGKWKQPSVQYSNYIIKATHNVTIQGVDTMSEAEYQDLLERLV